MAASVEADLDGVVLDLDAAGGFDESTVELFGRGGLVASQLRSKPAVTAVGDHRQDGVEVDIEPYLAGQTVQVKEVDARPQAVFDAVSPRVTNDHRAGSL